jgi:hypothetical protein
MIAAVYRAELSRAYAGPLSTRSSHRVASVDRTKFWPLRSYVEMLTARCCARRSEGVVGTHIARRHDPHGPLGNGTSDHGDRPITSSPNPGRRESPTTGFRTHVSERIGLAEMPDNERVSGEPSADDIERFFDSSSGACWRAEWLISAIEMRRSWW